MFLSHFQCRSTIISGSTERAGVHSHLHTHTLSHLSNVNIYRNLKCFPKFRGEREGGKRRRDEWKVSSASSAAKNTSDMLNSVCWNIIFNYRISVNTIEYTRQNVCGQENGTEMSGECGFDTANRIDVVSICMLAFQITDSRKKKKFVDRQSLHATLSTTTKYLRKNRWQIDS